MTMFKKEKISCMSQVTAFSLYPIWKLEMSVEQYMKYWAKISNVTVEMVEENRSVSFAILKQPNVFYLLLGGTENLTSVHSISQ